MVAGGLGTLVGTLVGLIVVSARLTLVIDQVSWGASDAFRDASPLWVVAVALLALCGGTCGLLLEEP